MNPFDFTGQVALVTGASSGMGLAAAQAFAEAGAAVALVDINADAVQAAAVVARVSDTPWDALMPAVDVKGATLGGPEGSTTTRSSGR